MRWRKAAVTGIAVAVGGVGLFAVTPLGRDVLFHALPMRWTGEAERLAATLNIRAGSAVADIGAGNGALIVELARIAGPGGQAFASERTAAQRQRIANRAASAGVTVTIVEAQDRATGFPDACCDAITMRMVMHHIEDPAAFAHDIRRALRPAGRVGVIDFAPGALPHLAGDHGSTLQQIREAFLAAGFAPDSEISEWGGRSFLLVFRVP